ncbi:hypothetical protein Tco_0190378 [Tanacetum coccineum]
MRTRIRVLRERESLEGEGHGLEDEGPGSEDEGPGTYEEEEEAALEGQQQLVSVVDIAMDKPLGLGYGALRRSELALGEGLVPSTFEVGHISRVYTDILTYVPLAAHVQTLPSPEWSSGSLLVSPSPPVVLSPIASPVTTLAATISSENHDLRRQIAEERRE